MQKKTQPQGLGGGLGGLGQQKKKVAIVKKKFNKSMDAFFETGSGKIGGKMSKVKKKKH